MKAARCSATSRRGAPCQQYAVLGAKVCRYHGGAAPQVRAAAARRVTLAAAIETGDRRSPAEVLLDAHHVLDVLLQLAKRDADSVTPDTVDALIAAATRAATMAKIITDARIKTWQVDDETVRQLAVLIDRAMAAAGLSPAQAAAVRQAFASEAASLAGTAITAEDDEAIDAELAGVRKLGVAAPAEWPAAALDDEPSTVEDAEPPPAATAGGRGMHEAADADWLLADEPLEVVVGEVVDEPRSLPAPAPRRALADRPATCPFCQEPGGHDGLCPVREVVMARRGW